MAETTAHLETRNAHLEQVNHGAEERIARLMAIVKMIERARYGAGSQWLSKDRLTDDQYVLALDEIETGVAAFEAEREKATGRSNKRPPRPRKGFAAHLERVKVVIEPDDPAGCDGLERIRIGEDVCERLKVKAPRILEAFEAEHKSALDTIAAKDAKGWIRNAGYALISN